MSALFCSCKCVIGKNGEACARQGNGKVASSRSAGKSTQQRMSKGIPASLRVCALERVGKEEGGTGKKVVSGERREGAGGVILFTTCMASKQAGKLKVVQHHTLYVVAIEGAGEIILAVSLIILKSASLWAAVWVNDTHALRRGKRNQLRERGNSTLCPRIGNCVACARSSHERTR